MNEFIEATEAQRKPIAKPEFFYVRGGTLVDKGSSYSFVTGCSQKDDNERYLYGLCGPGNMSDIADVLSTDESIPEQFRRLFSAIVAQVLLDADGPDICNYEDVLPAYLESLVAKIGDGTTGEITLHYQSLSEEQGCQFEQELTKAERS